jgi:hypothetical protein
MYQIDIPPTLHEDAAAINRNGRMVFPFSFLTDETKTNIVSTTHEKEKNRQSINERDRTIPSKTVREEFTVGHHPRSSRDLTHRYVGDPRRKESKPWATYSIRHPPEEPQTMGIVTPMNY